MKRTIITIAASLLALMPYGSFAQESNAGSRSDDFHGHWFIQAQGGIGATVGETKFGDLISPMATVSFGYQFTPVWSLRAGIGGWQGKGALVGPTQVYKYNFLQGNVDVMVDLCSIFSGYRVSRAVSPYLFAGVGINGSFNNDEAQSLRASFPSDNLLWDGSKVFPAGRFGVGTGIRISDAVQFNLELNGNFLSDRFNSKRGSAVDWQLGAQAGFTFRIGMKKHRRSSAATEPAYTPAPAPAPEPKEEPKPEPKPEPEVKPAPKPAPQAREYRENVYFVIGKYEIRDTESGKIGSVAQKVKSTPGATVVLTGYADAQTGSAKRNMYLSQKRAEAVAAALEEAGVEVSRIKVDYKGDTVAPYGSPEENRVVICIVGWEE